jgi:ABC-type antimicrobial peptide transport system permease subunit
MAPGALRAHRLRAVLTTLGLVIGVAAVIAIASLGAGTEARIVEQMREIARASPVATPVLETLR